MEILAERYELDAPAGAGGGASVFLARDLKLPGRRCAVKLVRVPNGRGADGARAAVLAEASLLARLDHPGLPRVSDVFQNGDAVGIVMDFVPGDSLLEIANDARRRNRPLDEVHIVRWAEALCDILSYLHHQAPPVLHRDVKPANVKLTPDGSLKLVDFGLAVELNGWREAGDRDVDDGAGEGRGGGGGSKDDETRTIIAEGGRRHGAVGHSAGGTAAYQALEQSSAGSRQDARTDLYALGATLYHLLAGHAPLSAQERFLTPARWRPLAAERPDLSAALTAAVDEAMGLHPDERPPEVEAFRRLLRRPRARAGAPGRESWREAWAQHRVLAVTVAVLWIVAVAVTLWLR